MSTKYRTKPPITLGQLRAGMPKGVEEFKPVRKRYEVPHFAITDGRHYVWAYEKTLGVVEFEEHGHCLSARDLLAKVAAAFNISIESIP